MDTITKQERLFEITFHNKMTNVDDVRVVKGKCDDCKHLVGNLQPFGFDDRNCCKTNELSFPSDTSTHCCEGFEHILEPYEEFTVKEI